MRAPIAWATSLGFALAAAGCFNPSYSSRTKCSPKRECPDGFSCGADDFCVANAGAGGAASGGHGGMAGGGGGTGGTGGGTAGTTGGGGRGGATGGYGGNAGTTGTAGTTGMAGTTGNAGRGGTGGSTGNAGRGGSAGGTAGTGGSAGTTGNGGTGGGTVINHSVLERNKNPSRDGHFLQPAMTKAAAMAMAPDAAFNAAATFSGNVAVAPLFLDGTSGGTGIFVVGTTDNDVVARREDGSMAWTRRIGSPGTGLGCQGSSVLGILGTPVIDGQSRTIYVAGATADGGSSAQIVTAIDAADGAVKSGWPVNLNATFDAKIHNQRGAMSLVGGTLYIPYGGYIGDCGNYRGRVVAMNTGSAVMFAQWQTAGQGEGIWAPGGLASDGNGVFAITGNRTGTAGGAHQDSEEVVRVTPSGTAADYFYPTTWQDMDDSDADFGSVNPMVITVPGAMPSKLVVAIAKDGKGYLLDAAQLRGTTSGTAAGGQKLLFTLASGNMSIITVPASYRTAMGTYVVLSTTSGATGCPGGGTGRQVMAVRIGANPLSATIAWCAPMSNVTTGPIATTTDGTSDAIVWFLSAGQLRGVDGDTGTAIYSSTDTCAGVQKWTSPIAVKGRIVAAANGRLCAWGVSGALTQAPPDKAKRTRKQASAASLGLARR